MATSSPSCTSTRGPARFTSADREWNGAATPITASSIASASTGEGRHCSLLRTPTTRSPWRRAASSPHAAIIRRSRSWDSWSSRSTAWERGGDGRRRSATPRTARWKRTHSPIRSRRSSSSPRDTRGSMASASGSGGTRVAGLPQRPRCSTIRTCSRSASRSPATTTTATTRTTGESDNYAADANQMHAANLRGKLLLAHGGMDDNVPPSNTYLVVDALIKANKDFDLLILPNARHGYGRDGLYMMRRRWDYFVRNLLGAEPPREYEIGKKTSAAP